MTFSKVLALASLALIAGAAPGWAADWGGVKDMGGGVAVPVPAPAPVPTFDADSDWYIGLAIGANISQSATINSYITDSVGDVTPGAGARDSSDIGASPIFGLSFGRYLTPSLRAEIAVDYSRSSTIASSNQSNIATLSASALSALSDPGGNPTFDTSSYQVGRTDLVKLSRTTALVNLIYDIHTGTRFTPYIGGGVGFTWRQMKRSFSETANCTQSSNTFFDYPPGYCVNTAELPSSSTISGKTTKDQFDFAAAVQAGIAYNITDQITWDNGWQMLWEGNAISTTVPTVGGDSTVVYKNATLQQFRSGIRIRFD